jgi:hypothetical protein
MVLTDLPHADHLGDSRCGDTQASGFEERQAAEPEMEAQEWLPDKSDAILPSPIGDRAADHMEWAGGATESGSGNSGKEVNSGGRGPPSSGRNVLQATMSGGSISSDDEGYFPRQRHRDAFKQKRNRRRNIFQPSRFG